MPQCKTIGIHMGRKRETIGRKNDTKNENANIPGTIRLLYKPSLILAAEM
jgi:hypothetical protein